MLPICAAVYVYVCVCVSSSVHALRNDNVQQRRGIRSAEHAGYGWKEGAGRGKLVSWRGFLFFFTFELRSKRKKKTTTKLNTPSNYFGTKGRNTENKTKKKTISLRIWTEELHGQLFAVQQKQNDFNPLESFQDSNGTQPLNVEGHMQTQLVDIQMFRENEERWKIMTSSNVSKNDPTSTLTWLILLVCINKGFWVQQDSLLLCLFQGVCQMSQILQLCVNILQCTLRAANFREQSWLFSAETRGERGEEWGHLWEVWVITQRLKCLI